MKKLIVFLLFLLVFSSCSSFRSSENNVPQIDTKGNGLEVDFDIDDRWISQRQVTYYITLANTGQEPIELSRENFRLRTLHASNNDLNTPVFTQESIDMFYERILRGGNIMLYQNAAEINLEGQLLIEDSFFENVNNEEVDYELVIEYPYETSLRSNVEIDLSKRDKLRMVDRLQQAAPVKIKDIEISPSALSSTGYDILYYIENSDRSQIAEIDDINIEFGANNRLSDCGLFKEDKTRLDSFPILLGDDMPQVIYVCSIDLDDVTMADPTTFSTSGTINYNYIIRKEGTIKLPEISEGSGFER